ncbi:radical SAM protein [Desulfovibrio sp. OttesenSCG-928-G11]|nr:radical SAM protein [Desulfovibrio sp. OttesenSCG-928-G11]
MKLIPVMKSVPPLRFEQLRARADSIRKESIGDSFALCAVIGISNYCRCNCLYCDLRKSNRALVRRRLGEDEILAAAFRAAKEGADILMLRSGEDIFFRKQRIARLVGRIKDETGLALSLSLGSRKPEEYKLWRQAGADSYVLHHKSADEMIYAAYHPGDSLKKRIAALRTLRDLGFASGTGFIIGLPGQSDEVLMRDILLTQSLGAAVCAVRPFIGRQNTPMGHMQPGSAEKSLKVIAYLRSHMPGLHIPATGALLGLLPEQKHNAALKAGANVILRYYPAWDSAPRSG